MKRKNTKEILIIILLLGICILNFLKKAYFKIEFDIVKFCFENFLLIVLAILGNFKCRKNKFYKNLISIIVLIASILSLVFNSFNVFGFIILFGFLFLISIVTTVKTKLTYEISLVVSTSLLLVFFIILGLLNLLKFSELFVLIITVCSLFYLYKNKKQTIKQINSVNKTSLVIFSILYLIAILSGVGMYVHIWDEYSYWAYAAKVLINTDSFKMMTSSVSSMYNYPPVSSIWHYFVSIFSGYSEPNLYIGLSILTYIYMLPIFIYSTNKKLLFKILLVVSTVGFPLLFGGSISYGLLYVDLLLGVMCACFLVLNDYIDTNKLTKIPIYLLLILIVLLKPNGFVFACCLLFLIWLQKLVKLKEFTFKTIYTSVKKYAVIVIILLLTYGLWFLFSKIISDDSYGYMFKLMPDSLKADILPKLNWPFILTFLNGIINTFDESILYSFINIPLFAFLIIIFSTIVYIEKGKEDNEFKILIPYIIFYVTFLLLTALSLFVMFSYYEASILASFTRYLAPINIALGLFVLYKLSQDIKLQKSANIFCIVIILLIGFSNCTFFITNVKERINNKNVSEQRNEIFSVINDNTNTDSKVYVLNQTDDDNIMPIWYARFYCYPRIVNASSEAISWKIKTESNEWDLQYWGLDYSSFANHLIEYDFDYLFLYSKTDELYDVLDPYFDDVINLKEYSLFKINQIDNTIKLIPLK